MRTVGRRPDPKVDRDVVHRSGEDLNEPSLRVRGELVVQAADDASVGPEMVLLNEIDIQTRRFEVGLTERLEEAASVIGEDLGRDEHDLGDL